MNIFDINHPKADAVKGLVQLCSCTVNGDKLKGETRKRIDAHRAALEETIAKSPERIALDNLLARERENAAQTTQKKSDLERGEAALSTALAGNDEGAVTKAREALWRDEAAGRALDRESQLIRSLVVKAEKNLAALRTRTENEMRRKFITALAAEVREKSAKLIELISAPDVSKLLSEFAVVMNTMTEADPVTQSISFPPERTAAPAPGELVNFNTPAKRLAPVSAMPTFK